MSDPRMERAVREGVHDAVWQMITNATHAPCQDFYQTVGDAVKAAVSEAIMMPNDDDVLEAISSVISACMPSKEEILDAIKDALRKEASQ